jgi:capsule polysaccharide modification protein KpsS
MPNTSTPTKPTHADYYVMQDEDNTIVAIIDCRGYPYDPIKRAIQEHLDIDVISLSMGQLEKWKVTTIKATVEDNEEIPTEHVFTLTPAPIYWG